MKIALSSMWDWPFPVQWFGFYQILDELNLGIEWNPRKGDVISLNKVYSCHYPFSDKLRDKFVFASFFRKWDLTLTTKIETIGAPVVIHPIDLVRDWEILDNIRSQLVLEFKFGNKFRTIDDILNAINDRQVKAICIDIGYLIQYLSWRSESNNLMQEIAKVIQVIRKQGLKIRIVHVWDWDPGKGDLFGKNLLLGEGKYSKLVKQVLYQIIIANTGIEVITLEFLPATLKPWQGKKKISKRLQQSIEFLNLNKSFVNELTFG